MKYSKCKITCPECRNEKAYLVSEANKGMHYECYDCGKIWRTPPNNKGGSKFKIRYKKPLLASNN